MLKYENIKHRRTTDGSSLDTYRIKDELEYTIDVFEYDYRTKSWKPFLTDDIQIEFTMLNPYYILQMKMLAMGKPTYMVSFKAPDRWGVFKFIIDYKRLGYSYLDVSTKVINFTKHSRYLYDLTTTMSMRDFCPQHSLITYQYSSCFLGSFCSLFSSSFQRLR